MSSSDNSQPATCTSFHVFPRLPIELRFKVWECTSMAARTLELTYLFREPERRFRTEQQVPAVLRVCRESRRVGKRIYQLSFGTSKCPPKTYFNPISDIIYFGFRIWDDEVRVILKFFRRMAEYLEEKDQIQRIALSEHLWRVDRKGSLFAPTNSLGTARKIELFHESFPHLKELMLVTDQDECEDEDDIEAEWETIAGVSLVKRQSAEQDVVQKAVIANFDALRKDYPDELFPDVVAMGYGV
ncbi:hypothetical protein LSUE1_G000307 [Lachnellula suecica]|uniref:2EXR domain-containing protein n=1 Tax=Lachnellula suecica TaxID=602035 RepID=A0A8T9CIB3_9HELO|nr:hypothetical protein LSUE1_G000307 [Lachnellula suecica]